VVTSLPDADIDSASKARDSESQLGHDEKTKRARRSCRCPRCYGCNGVEEELSCRVSRVSHRLPRINSLTNPEAAYTAPIFGYIILCTCREAPGRR
jgi:hypothetical protein